MIRLNTIVIYRIPFSTNQGLALRDVNVSTWKIGMLVSTEPSQEVKKKKRMSI
jgi:hydroxymethylpyrimidine/phosphomethylpyrimidine kinase